jgi:CheY-like chemotaxis protein
MTDVPLQRVVYVEDDLDIQFVAKLALEARGLTVLVCSSGHEALEKAKAFEPDLLLLDVMMPGLDGPATLKAMRLVPALARVPVVFMTAKVQPQEVEQYKAMDALGVISKPFDPMTLVAQLQSLWSARHEG